MMKSGIYGLFRFDGGPVDLLEAEALGLNIPGPPGPAHAQAIDESSPGAVDSARDAGELTILVGYVEEPQELSARLGLFPIPRAAVLARAALRRFGSETPSTMIGEWTLLHWDVRGQLTLMMSAARRDRLFFAISGPRVAVAPDIFRLSRISWIGTMIDEAGLLFPLGRAILRAGAQDSTILAQARQLDPGTSVTIDAGVARKETAAILVPQPRWTGSFDDAVVETEHLMRRIMRARMARTTAPAALLSGGLDSSILSWLAAEERDSSQRLLLITSVAPRDSGLRDEAGYADLVAETLGLKSEHVSPPEDSNIYRPPDHILAGSSFPPMGTRHCLTETFQIVARALDATQIIDGLYGELSITSPWPLPTIARRLRRMATRLRAGMSSAPRRSGPGWFHVRLASHRLANPPERVRAAMQAPAVPEPAFQPNGLWGYMPGTDRALRHPNEFYPGALRMDLPYRDLRLLRLFARFPAEFLVQKGLNRAPARHMLAGHLPDSIRLRTSGLPASPDHLVRLMRQAPIARERIATFRKVGVQEWLDLDWLDTALARFAARGPTSYPEANEVQLTAITAEFLTWWFSHA